MLSKFKKKNKSPKPSPNKLNRGRAKKQNRKLWVVLFKLSIVLLFWASIFFFMLFIYLIKDLPDISEMARNNIKPQITIRSYDGIVLAKYGDLHGNNLTYSQIPIYLSQAVIAAEDQRFYNHFGIDIFGILRAYYTNLKAGKIVQGGSTITQQLAKIIYLSPERTFKRKLQEALIAIQLERQFSKEQILTMYLNRVYLGKGNYGVDAAARYYFGKYAQDLELFECAILAGMLKAPSKYAPSNNPKFSITRAHYVLHRMADEGFITVKEEKNAKPPSIVERGVARGALKNPYFTDYILSMIPDLIENHNQDLDIQTTLNMGLQRQLEVSSNKLLNEYKAAYNISQVAGVIMEPSGAIRAMLGGKDYSASEFNRVVVAKRQPGSAFKFFVYAAAMENGYNLSDTFVDKPISLEQGKGLPKWTPKNYYKDEYSGEMTLDEAFSRSINTIAVQLSEQVGRKKVIELAHRLGITSSIKNLPSIALGATEVSLLELTQAFAHIANDGIKTKAFGILQVKDTKGNILYEYPGLSTERVLSEDVVSKMRILMTHVVDYGTARNAKILFSNVYGKTGTSQDYRDAWFVGSNDKLVAGIWLGNDDNSPMKKVVGGTVPAKVFKDVFENMGEIDRVEIPNNSTPWRQKGVFDMIFGSSDSHNNHQAEVHEETNTED